MIAWLVAHHVLIGWLAISGLNLAIKVALNLRPLTDWVAIAEKHPRVAALVRLLDALGISPISALQSLVDLVRNSASAGTLASAKALQVSASKPLISPPKVTP